LDRSDKIGWNLAIVSNRFSALFVEDVLETDTIAAIQQKRLVPNNLALMCRRVY
jgi:hypothetical protein